MISKLSLDEILKLIQMKPEQAVFDWKVDFDIPNDPEKQGELIKDVTAIANAITLSPGFIVYGTDPRQPNPVLGISKTYDDAKLQQLFKDKVKPAVAFIYYEVSLGPKIIGVVQVSPTRRRPHIISVNIGKMRDGQIPIRRGSSTEGVKIEDLFEMFYGESSGYFLAVIQQQQLNIKQQQSSIELIKLLNEQIEKGERDMRRSIGLPPEFY